jgi:hypothetical protein
MRKPALLGLVVTLVFACGCRSAHPAVVARRLMRRGGFTVREAPGGVEMPPGALPDRLQRSVERAVRQIGAVDALLADLLRHRQQLVSGDRNRVRLPAEIPRSVRLTTATALAVLPRLSEAMRETMLRDLIDVLLQVRDDLSQHRTELCKLLVYARTKEGVTDWLDR